MKWLAISRLVENPSSAPVPDKIPVVIGVVSLLFADSMVLSVGRCTPKMFLLFKMVLSLRNVNSSAGVVKRWFYRIYNIPIPCWVRVQIPFFMGGRSVVPVYTCSVPQGYTRWDLRREQLERGKRVCKSWFRGRLESCERVISQIRRLTVTAFKQACEALEVWRVWVKAEVEGEAQGERKRFAEEESDAEGEGDVKSEGDQQ
ncbi:hypothetical protein CBR_g48906 [Chara braunii]|uniref:Uncharacterized protein n=1 Tax=Chara braunii TaxID=69332 RepID=A0A388M3M9_CHABU|nr:hypothetical protein CBR_g48906 [Chara braunii]|eukprot:GBG89198.1 hypothetical protein CBR_g48906 [Chara braunii]